MYVCLGCACIHACACACIQAWLYEYLTHMCAYMCIHVYMYFWQYPDPQVLKLTALGLAPPILKSFLRLWHYLYYEMFDKH